MMNVIVITAVVRRNKMKLYDELLWRGLIENITVEELIEKINNGGLTF